MNPSPAPSGEKIPPGRAYSVAIGAGSELLAWVALSVYVGRKADVRFNTEPWLLLVSILAGIFIGLYRLIRETAIRPNDPSKRL